MTAAPHTIGDPIQYWAGGDWSRFLAWGTITKITKAGTVTVEPEHGKGKPLTFRASGPIVWPSEYVIAMRAWCRKIPHGRVVHALAPFGVQRPGYFTGDEVTLGMQAAADLKAIRAWLNSEPQRPEGEPL